MKLNIPTIESLMECDNLLIAGMGGGFDIFCGLPIYFELVDRNKRVHLANFSFSDIERANSGVRLTDTLAEIVGESQRITPYFPEQHLSEWFSVHRGERVPVWCFHKTGAKQLVENYRALVEHLSIDGILLVDGGVDALVRGDEAETATLIEDALSLFAVAELDNVGFKGMCCLGFGIERSLSYGQILENIADLTKAGAFLGCCSLTNEMDSYRHYESAVLYVQAKQYQDPSVINSSIVSAARGHFGNYHLTKKTYGSVLWISPLMTLYWFFDLEKTADHNLYLDALRSSTSFMDAFHKFLDVRPFFKPRNYTEIPLR